MEEVNVCKENLIYCLNKLDLLISEINAFNDFYKKERKRASYLGITFENVEDITCEELEDIKSNYQELIEKSCDKYQEIQKIKTNLDNEIENIIGQINEQINKIKKTQIENIYKKVIELIYKAKWDQKQREIEYLNYKDTVFSKIIGEAKYRKLLIRKNQIEAELIKKEYIKQYNNYKNQTVDKIIMEINNCQEKDYQIINFKEKLTSIFFVDKKVLNSIPKTNWKAADIIPAGFLEKIKHYKILNNALESEIILLNEKMGKNEKTDTDSMVKDKLKTLKDINDQIRNLIFNIKINQ